MNNMIEAFPIADEKGRTVIWDENSKRAYRKRKAKQWAKAFAKIPNFKAMNSEAIEAWHSEQSIMGKKIKDFENHQNQKKCP